MDHSAYTAPSSNISRSKYPEEVDLIGDHCATRENGKAGLGLLDLPLEVIEYILPHLLPHTILALSLASKAFHSLIFPLTTTSDTRGHSLRAWRHIDLSDAQPTVEPKRPHDQLPSPPLSPVPCPGYFRFPQYLLHTPNVLQYTRTLVLDRLLVVSHHLIEDLFTPPARLGSTRCNIQILSVRGCPNLHDRAFAEVVRRVGVPGTLKGIYYFSNLALDFAPPPEGGVTDFVSPEITRAPARKAGVEGGWETIMAGLKGRVTFDTELCRGRDHFRWNSAGEWETVNLCVATMRISAGCAGCGASPCSEDKVDLAGPADCLFPPAPLHTSSIAAAKSSDHLACGKNVTLRCAGCLDKRHCRGCYKWWCTPCSLPFSSSLPPTHKSHVSLDCYECGALCASCTALSSRKCKACSGAYCVQHNEGSTTLHLCEWCIMSTASRAARRGSVTAAQAEVEAALRSVAMIVDPAAASGGGARRINTISTPPTSPHLGPVPQPVPVVFLSSSASAATAAKGKLSPETHKSPVSAVGPRAGMRLRTMMGDRPGVQIHPQVRSQLQLQRDGGVSGGAGCGSGGGNGTGLAVLGIRIGVPAGPGEVGARVGGEIERRRWLGRE